MFIADLHIHSKYSRATSPECTPGPLDLWARKKGLSLIGTGDCTHAAWREELKAMLAPAEEGLFKLRAEYVLPSVLNAPAPRFLITGEISSIYKKNGKVRKVHNLLLLPSLEHAEKLSKKLEAQGANLHSDGRPILGMDSRDLLEITLEACPEAVFIPAHIWTPHFSLFGAYSGFDTIEECFEDLTPHIRALETGLSSDPPMNWRLSALDGFALVSNSDAHSPAKLAREANLFETDLSYPSLARALSVRGSKEFLGTIEFFPEEGKYHFDGHRNCNVCQKPSRTRETGGTCPVCGRRITVGVLHRVEVLADREEGHVPGCARHFESLVPLQEVIAASMGLSSASKKVAAQYEALLAQLGPELFILREASLSDINLAGGPILAEAMRRLRQGEVTPSPGYDGIYGSVEIFSKSDLLKFSGQFSFPGLEEALAPKKKQNDAAPSLPGPVVDAGTVAHAPSESLPYGLNKRQWQAASAKDPVVAVLAGPGTGKTKTLVSRIACLVERMGVSPKDITAVTFTNKAALEMRERLQSHFGSKDIVRRMTIGTFHSICLRLLTGPDDKPSVVDEFGAQAILTDILSILGIKQSARETLKEISKIKNGAAGSVRKEILTAYAAQLAEYGLLDFDDILLRVLERLESPDKNALPRPVHLLVDEFQDINDLQYRLIRSWAADGKGLFVIGDPDQSIYGFRGSSARCFDRLQTDWPDVRTIGLLKNYRSTPQIIGCALSVLSRGSNHLSPSREEGRPVRIVRAPDAFSEALFITKEIGRMVGGIDLLAAHAHDAAAKPMGFSDIAVLYRTHRQADLIGECLGIEGIPYIVAGRDDFLSDASVRAAIGFFNFLLSPEDISSLRIWLQASNLSVIQRKELLNGYAAKKSALTLLLERYPQSQPLAGLYRRFSSRIKNEKPGKLIEGWINENTLAGNQSMERLLGAAVMNPDMPSLLHNLSLGRESDVVRSGNKKRPPDAVLLTTLHGAKGLEFPVVFLTGATDGVLPLKTGKAAANPSEERRLFYVGITRAKEELVILHTPEPSPFLAGFPAKQYQEEQLYKKQSAKQLSLFGT